MKQQQPKSVLAPFTLCVTKFAHTPRESFNIKGRIFGRPQDPVEPQAAKCFLSLKVSDLKDLLIEILLQSAEAPAMQHF